MKFVIYRTVKNCFCVNEIEQFKFLSLSQKCEADLTKKYYVYRISYTLQLYCHRQRKIFEEVKCTIYLKGLLPTLTKNMSATVDFIQESSKSRIELKTLNSSNSITKIFYTVGNLEVYVNASKFNLHSRAMVAILNNSEF